MANLPDKDSLQHQLAEARENLRLMEERESEYPLSTDIPLWLVKEKRRLLDKIAKLEQQLTAQPAALEAQREQALPTVAGPVFISYAREDQAYAHKLAADLGSHGFETWMDDRIDFGDRWWQTIVQAIRASAAFVVVMTPDAEQSEWVENEVLLAKREKKPIFPLLLRGQGFPLLITVQHADVTGGRMPPASFYKRLAGATLDEAGLSSTKAPSPLLNRVRTYASEHPTILGATLTILAALLLINLFFNCFDYSAMRALLYSTPTPTSSPTPLPSATSTATVTAQSPSATPNGLSIFTPDLFSPTLTPTPTLTITFTVKADQEWQDTGIVTRAGGKLTITYLSGTWSNCPAFGCPYVDANGVHDSGGCINCPDNFLLNCSHAALIAMVNGDVQCVGNTRSFTTTQSGNLQLRINDKVLNDNAGSITFRITTN